jgi:antitoxin VapB
MPLTIQNPEAERLAKDVAKQTGERLEDAVVNALRERLERLTPMSERLALAAKRLLADYENDQELTSFTALDGEPIHAER